MSRKVRIGILGCANIAKKYAIRAFQAIDNAEVVSIASRDLRKAKEYASIFSIPNYQSYDALLENPQVDAIYLPLPIGLHKEWIIKAAKVGKHVMSEKSLTTSFSLAKEIIQTARRKNIVLYENFACDFHPQHRKVLSLVTKGVIGEQFLFRGFFGIPLLPNDSFRYNKKLGGSALYELGAYPIFMARKIFNSEPVSVDAQLFFDQRTGIDMHGIAQLAFTDNHVAQIAFNLNSIYQNNYSLFGSKGSISVKRAYAIPPEMKPELELVTNDSVSDQITKIVVSEVNQFELIFKNFCNVIIQKNRYSMKIQKINSKILFQAKVLEAIKLSAQKKRKVLLEEIV